MPNEHESQTQQLRQQVQTVVERAKSDPEYKQELQSKPEETLRAAGIPEVSIGYLASELTNGSQGAAEAEVSGYMMAACDGITCIITCCSYNTQGSGWSVKCGMLSV